MTRARVTTRARSPADIVCPRMHTHSRAQPSGEEDGHAPSATPRRPPSARRASSAPTEGTASSRRAGPACGRTARTARPTALWSEPSWTRCATCRPRWARQAARARWWWWRRRMMRGRRAGAPAASGRGADLRACRAACWRRSARSLASAAVPRSSTQPRPRAPPRAPTRRRRSGWWTRRRRRRLQRRGRAARWIGAHTWLWCGRTAVTTPCGGRRGGSCCPRRWTPRRASATASPRRC
mmetsp:Transcript_13067/g.45691  ORF Transcript_13067/g.45691 Transcript_13067/m.45691 type:complete len:239 (+) Transcript_13067:279-995(+)